MLCLHDVSIKTQRCKSVSNTSSGPVTASEKQKAVRERALQIKQLQESALAALPQRKLYIVLWVCQDPLIANDFHWAFYYHRTTAGGINYHMKGIGAGWIADHGYTGCVFKSQFLCVLIEIGNNSGTKQGRLTKS